MTALPRHTWLSGLPERVAWIAREWELPDMGPPFQPDGTTSYLLLERIVELQQ